MKLQQKKLTREEEYKRKKNRLYDLSELTINISLGVLAFGGVLAFCAAMGFFPANICKVIGGIGFACLPISFSIYASSKEFLNLSDDLVVCAYCLSYTDAKYACQGHAAWDKLPKDMYFCGIKHYDLFVKNLKKNDGSV